MVFPEVSFIHHMNLCFIEQLSSVPLFDRMTVAAQLMLRSMSLPTYAGGDSCMGGMGSSEIDNHEICNWL